MAVHVEDHPISYNSFEGEIPPGQYGAGKVIIWDKGTWLPLEDPRRGYRDGKLKFELRGHKLKGHWALVRMRKKQKRSRKPGCLSRKKTSTCVRPATSAWWMKCRRASRLFRRRRSGQPPCPA